jgi:hypothetical protein
MVTNQSDMLEGRSQEQRTCQLTSKGQYHMSSYFRGTSTEFETSCSPQGEPETRRLPRAAQLPPIAGLPCVESPTTVPNPILFEPDGWMSTPMVRRPSDPLSNPTKFLIATAVAVLPAGYLVFGNSDRPAEVAVAPANYNRYTTRRMGD